MIAKTNENEKIQLNHPHGKHMPRIDKDKFDVIKKAMISILKSKELTHTELLEDLEKKLKGKFEGNIGWYAEGVKLHLEAEGEIERFGKSPQKYRLC